MVVIFPPGRKPVTVLIGLDSAELAQIADGGTVGLDGVDLCLLIGPADVLREQGEAAERGGLKTERRPVF